jgi:uncharacterized membrane protein YdcZ (DUF606 family)
MNVRRYHAISAYLGLTLAVMHTLLITILNLPSYLNDSLFKPKNNIFLLSAISFGIILVLLIIVSWIRKHYYKDLTTRYDFIKYGAIRGFLAPVIILLTASVIVHSGSIVYILINISTPNIWEIVIEWSRFYLYYLPLIVFFPILILFTLTGALLEKRLYQK